ncbi:MAG: hypothetical protein QOJ07_982, partial [Thermoleophilaceae bacterium]|nr:hypothetical protein [Thermoleophilaceae bacterium]
QLLRLGMRRGDIGRRVAGGRLHVMHHGVYAVGHKAVSAVGHLMAAVLAAGEDAVLSHRSAAGHWGIAPSARALIEVTVPRRVDRPRIQVHRHALPLDEVAVHEGIPLTSVHRTILDLAATSGRARLESAIHEADVRRLYDRLSLPDLLARHPRRPGAATLRAILADGVMAPTRNEFERRFAELLAAAGVPRPRFNAPVRLRGNWIEVDALWERERLIVELDGYAVHGTPRAFESDHARDRMLHADRWLIIRVTWRQLEREPAEVVADICRALAARAPGAG